MNIYIIYKLIFPNNKIYIGQTNDFKRRMNQYKNLKENYSNKYLYNSIIKYGWNNVKKEILFTTTKEYINNAEQYFIIRYNSKFENGNGYNLTDGGEKDYSVSEETKKKMRKPKSENHRINISKSKMGKRCKPFSDKHKINMSKSKMGKNNPMFNVKHSKEYNEKISISLQKPIEVYTKCGNYIGIFSSQKQASEKLNLNSAHICNVLKGRLNSTGGYKFKYLNRK